MAKLPQVHYHFVDTKSMEEMIERKEFLETAHVHGNIYGTSAAAVRAVGDKGKICILDIDVQVRSYTPRVVYADTQGTWL